MAVLFFNLENLRHSLLVIKVRNKDFFFRSLAAGSRIKSTFLFCNLLFVLSNAYYSLSPGSQVDSSLCVLLKQLIRHLNVPRDKQMRGPGGCLFKAGASHSFCAVCPSSGHWTVGVWIQCVCFLAMARLYFACFVTTFPSILRCYK